MLFFTHKQKKHIMLYSLMDTECWWTVMNWHLLNVKKMSMIKLKCFEVVILTSLRRLLNVKNVNLHIGLFSNLLLFLLMNACYAYQQNRDSFFRQNIFFQGFTSITIYNKEWWICNTCWLGFLLISCCFCWCRCCCRWWWCWCYWIGRDVFRFRLHYLRFGTYAFIDNIVANYRGSSDLD